MSIIPLFCKQYLDPVPPKGWEKKSRPYDISRAVMAVSVLFELTRYRKGCENLAFMADLVVPSLERLLAESRVKNANHGSEQIEQGILDTLGRTLSGERGLGVVSVNVVAGSAVIDFVSIHRFTHLIPTHIGPKYNKKIN